MQVRKDAEFSECIQQTMYFMRLKKVETWKRVDEMCKLVTHGVAVAFALLLAIVPSGFIRAEMKSQQVNYPEVPRISAFEAMQLHKLGRLVLADANYAGMHEWKHIAGSKSFPGNRLQLYHTLPRDRVVAFYCDCVDDAIAAKAAAFYWHQGYDKVRVVTGGSGMLQRAGFKMWFRK